MDKCELDIIRWNMEAYSGRLRRYLLLLGIHVMSINETIETDHTNEDENV